MEQLNKIAEKIDSLSIRERAIVFIGVIFVVYSIWNTFMIAPLEEQQKGLVAELNNKNAERLVLVNKFQTLKNASKTDPDKENLEELKKLRSKLMEVQAALESSTDNLVTPKDMPKILETVLHKTGGLTLVNLKSLGVTPLIAQVESKEDEEIGNQENTPTTENANTDNRLTAGNIDNAYRHGLRIEFIGDYMTTLNYLKSLEELKWGFFWDNFHLSVSEYPEANAAIEIYTLSLNYEWIGV